MRTFVALITIIVLVSSAGAAVTYFSQAEWQGIKQSIAGEDFAAVDNVLRAAVSRAVEQGASGSPDRYFQDIQDAVSAMLAFQPSGEPLSEDMIEALGSLRQASEEYQPALVGGPSAAAFKLFAQAYDGQDFEQALVYRKLTLAFKSYQIQMDLTEARQALDDAGSLVRERKYVEARAKLDQLSFDPGRHPEKLQVADSLRMMDDIISKGEADVQAYEDSWSQNALSTHRFVLSVRGGLIHQGEVSDLALDFVPGQDLTDATIKSINGASRLGVGGEAMYMVHPHIGVGADLQYRRYIINNDESPQVASIDVDVNCLSYHVFARYLLRTQVGMRPYISVGLGQAQYKYTDVEVYVLEETYPGSGLEPVAYALEDRDYSSMEYMFDIGSEYIISSEHHLMLGARVFSYFRSDDDKYIGKSTTGIDVSVGVAF